MVFCEWFFFIETFEMVTIKLSSSYYFDYEENKVLLIYRIFCTRMEIKIEGISIFHTKL